MLSVKTTEKLSGVTISGTYWDLNALYDALTNVIGEEGSYPEYETCSIRVLGLCYEIRNAYQADRTRGRIEYGDEVFSFEYFWPEMVFIYGVLKEFINLSEGSQCYLRREGAERLFYNPKTKDALLNRLPDDIAFVRYFRNLIINALRRTIDERRFKKIYRALEDRFSYTLMKRYYNNFCTQWVDIQNVKYLKRVPEKRKTYLATISEKIMFDNSDYDEMEEAVLAYAREYGVPYYEIELNGMQYPNTIEW